MTAASEIIMGKMKLCPLMKINPDFPEKYPETQTRPKKPRSSGKNPAVVTLAPTCVVGALDNALRGGRVRKCVHCDRSAQFYSVVAR